MEKTNTKQSSSERRQPRSNTAVNEVSIPTIGESGNLNLPGALAEKEYLQNHPKPQYGWSSGTARRIEQRIITLNTMIADMALADRDVVSERKAGNG